MKEQIKLFGSPNFRDIGGYEADGGRYIKRGRVFRSGALNRLKPPDFDVLEALSVSVICDLRTEDEVEKFPSLTFPNRHPVVENYAIHGNGGLTQIGNQHPVMTNANSETGDIVDKIKGVYRHFAIQHVEQYRQMFDLLLSDSSYPIIVHCTAGKDRTGIAIALIMRALGVASDTIIHEYELTNQLLIGKKREERIAAILPEGFKYNPDTVDAMIAARAEYLEAAFSEIDKAFGAFENYLKDGLGLTEDKNEKLKAHLLEDK